MNISANVQFIEQLEQRTFKDDHEKAVCSLNFIEEIITETEWNELSNVCDNINNFSALVKARVPLGTITRNMAVRMLKIINDEYYAVKQKSNQSEVDHLKIVKENVLDYLQEVKAEFDQCQEVISVQSEKMIHSNEIILTNGYCPSTLSFLLAAAKSRKFHVVVVESRARLKGERMVKSLVKAGVQTTFMEDDVVAAFMSRVNKVILDCNTVFLDGGMKTSIGGSGICLAAHQYAIPVYVCTPTYKLSVVKMEDAGKFFSKDTSGLYLTNSVKGLHDIVPPEHIESYITNERMVAPRHVYRQLKKLYFPLPRNIYEKAVSFTAS